MSFFESLLGNAAITGQGMVGREIANQQSIEQDERRSAVSLANSKSLADHNDALQAARAVTTSALKREMSQKDGQAISDGADQMRQQRIADQIGGQSGTPLTEEQAKTIAASPEALKASGIVDRTRVGAIDDQISVAQKLGLEDHVKNLRGQQDVEYNRDRLVSRDKKDDANTDIQNRKLDQQYTLQMAQLVESRQHNRALEKSAADAAKISPAARAQIGMEESRLDAARQQLALTVTQSRAAATSMDPIAIEEANAAITKAQGGITAALDNYNTVGRGHFGDQWVSVKTADPQAVSASLTKADAAASDAAAAVATGRISMADANKRLTAAGFKPLAAPAKDQETKTAKPASEGGVDVDAVKRKIADLLSRSELPGVDPYRALEFRREADALQKGLRSSSVLGGYQK